MNISNLKTTAHPDEKVLADFLADCLTEKSRLEVEEHLGSCDSCLEKVASAHDVVSRFNKKVPHKQGKGSVMKKLNIYLTLALVTFVFSFITPRFFIQLLVATLLLGIKWIVDSKSTKMLVMIHEAWKKDGAKGASEMLETLDAKPKNRIFPKKLK